MVWKASCGLLQPAEEKLTTVGAAGKRRQIKEP
jgi:hypothetical protein